MAKSRIIQTAFTSGVLTPTAKGRIDIQQYFNGLETGENVVLVPQGGVRRRQGTKHIQDALPVLNRRTETPTMPEGGTGATINDDDDGTSTATTNNIGTSDPYVVAQYDLSAGVYIENVDLRQIKLTVSGTSTEFVIQSSDDGAAWTTRATVPEIGTTEADFRLRVATTAQWWRLARVGSTDLTTNKIDLAEFNLNEKTTTLSKVELKGFSTSTDDHYLMAFTDENCRIFKDDAFVADIKTPYSSAEVNALRDTQSESVMILVHEDHPPRKIINLATDTDWSTELVTFVNVPQFDYNDSSSPTPVDEVQVLTFSAGWVPGDTFQIDIEGTLSKNITFAGDATAAERSSTAFNIEKNIQEMAIMGDEGVSVARTGALAYTITISGESTKAFELFSGFPTAGTASKTLTFTQSAQGTARKEDVWSATRGWPKTVAYYEGRLWFGGTKSKKQSIFASKAGLPFNFDTGEGDDDEAIFVTIATKKLNQIIDILPGRRMQIFTNGSEFTIKESPSTPGNIAMIPQTSHGSSNVEAEEIDGATLFIDRNGKTLREYLYSFNEDAYISNDISVLSPELLITPVDMAILGGTASDDANWVFIVNSDGSAAVLNTLRSQDINGFTKWTTSGALENCAVVDDELYMINKRTINSTDVRVIEKASFDFQMDNAITQTFGSPATAISNLDHLEGETVKVVGDGSVMQDRVVSGGAITIENAKTTVQVGLPYVPIVKSLPVATNIGSGVNQLRIRKIVRMNIRVKDTTGIEIEGNYMPVRSFGDSSSSPLDSAPNSTTGIIADYHPTECWTRDTMPEIKQNDPLPMHILSIEYEVESS